MTNLVNPSVEVLDQIKATMDQTGLDLILESILNRYRGKVFLLEIVTVKAN